MREAYTLWEVITASFRLAKMSLFKIKGMIALLTFMVGIVIGGQMLLKFCKVNPDEYSTAFAIEFSLIMLLFVLIDFTIFYQINSIIRNEPATTRQSFQAIGKKLPHLIGALIVSGLVLFSVDNIFVKLIIPGLFFNIVLAFYYPMIVIEEDLNFIETFIKAIKYTWAKLLQNSLLLYIVLPIVSVIIGIVLVGILLIILFAVLTLMAVLLKGMFPLFRVLFPVGMALFTGLLISSLFIFYNIVITVQLYNLKNIHGEESVL